jgi:hypothetical protein
MIAPKAWVDARVCFEGIDNTLGRQTPWRREARDIDEGAADSGHDSADSREPE